MRFQNLAILFSLWAVIGCDDDSEKNEKLNISASRLTCNAPCAIDFEATCESSDAGTGEILWDFGDGTLAVTGTHLFENSGAYKVTASGNGCKASSLSVKIAEPMDVQISNWLVLPRSITAGSVVQGSFLARNLGADAVDGLDIAVFLSFDRRFDSTDLEIWRSPLLNLTEDRQSFEMELPVGTSVSSGDYYLLLVVDPDDLVGDADESDNLLTAPLEVRNNLQDGADLAFCGVKLEGVAGLLGEAVTLELGGQGNVEICVQNLGNEPVVNASYEVNFVHESGETITVSALSGFALAMSSSNTFSALIEVPAEVKAGKWQLVAALDPQDVVQERREDNNTYIWPGTLNLSAPMQVDGVDLALSNLVLDQNKVAYGQTLTGSILIENRGLTSVNRNFVVQFHAIPEAGGEGVQLRSSNISSLAAGEQKTLNLELPINERVKQGNYRLRAWADPNGATKDQNLSNNTRTSELLSLGGALDLDLAVSNISYSPYAVFVGETLHVEAQIHNLGMDATGPYDVAVVLYSDQQMSQPGTVIYSKSIENTEGYGSTDFAANIEVPADLDQQIIYFNVAVVVDPDLKLTGDRDRSNNTAISTGRLQVSGATGGCPEDVYEQNNSRAWSRFVSMNTTLSLAMCDHTDWFNMTVPSGFEIEITVEATPLTEGETLDFSVCAQDQNFQMLGCADLVGENRVLYLPPSDSSRIVVFEISSAQNFKYNLTPVARAISDESVLRLSQLNVTPSVVAPGGRISVDALAICNSTFESSQAQVNLVGSQLLTLGTVTIPACEPPFVPMNALFSLPESIPQGLWRLELSYSDLTIGTHLRVDASSACESDPYEPNGSPFETSGSMDLAVEMEPGTYTDLNVCKGDDDWYSIFLKKTERLDATIAFDSSAGDLELQLYDVHQNLISESRTLQDRESASILRAPADGLYYVRVFFDQNDNLNRQTQYRMTLEILPASICADDIYEPNGSPDETALLTDGTHLLKLCPGDSDWFRFAVTAGTTFSIVLSSENSAAILNLYNPDGDLVATDSRRVTYTAKQSGRHLFSVTSPSSLAISYSISMGGVAGVDLAVQDLSVQPEIVHLGEDVLVRANVANLRGDTVSNAQVRFSLSDGNQSQPIGNTIVSNLEGASSQLIELRVSLPELSIESPLLVAEIDPLHMVPDLDRSNNIQKIALPVRAACVDDDLRTNESMSTATPVAEFPIHAVICSYTEDWYVAELTAGEHAFEISFNAEDGDLDFEIYNENGELLARSATRSAPESVEFTLESDASIYMRVDGFLGDEAAYTLSEL